MGRRSEDGKVLSLMVEFSDRGKVTIFQDEKISEEEIESERRSTPPGSIGEYKDVMSENIESKLNKKIKKHGT